MKKAISYSITLLMIAASFAFTNRLAPDGFVLTGKITGFADKYIYLAHAAAGVSIVDSSLVKDGAFSFKPLKLKEPMQVFLHSKDRHLQKVFYAENVPMKVSGDAAALDKVVITGAKSQEDFTALEDDVNANRQKVIALWQQSENLKKESDSLKKESDRLYKYEWEIRKQFVLAHPKSIVSLQELMNWTSDANYKEARTIYEGLDPSIKKNEKAKEIELRLANLEKVALGNQASDFTQKDITGKNVNLASYKGNYVLLEFWASWCGPCRAENPNLRAAYEKYKNKGFNVLAVSLDDDAGKWKKAVEKDDLPWAQVSDLKGWTNVAAIQYGVRAIPANFLIDPQGKIVKRDLRGEELNKALAELFN
jgi:peroxiredoxin